MHKSLSSSFPRNSSGMSLILVTLNALHSPSTSKVIITVVSLVLPALIYLDFASFFVIFGEKRTVINQFTDHEQGWELIRAAHLLEPDNSILCHTIDETYDCW